MAHRWFSYLAPARAAGARTASERWEARSSFNAWPLSEAPASAVNSWLSEIGALRTAPDEIEREIRNAFLEGFHDYAAKKYERDLMPEDPPGSFYRVELYSLVRGGRAVGNGWMVRRVSPAPRGGTMHLTVLKFEGNERAARALAARLNRLSPGPEKRAPVMVKQTPAGWWQAPNVPSAQFRTRELAERAAELPPAEAWTLEIAQGTLARGDALMEHVYRAKLASHLPLTAEEVVWAAAKAKAKYPERAARHEAGGNPRVSRSARDMTLKARIKKLVRKK